MLETVDHTIRIGSTPTFLCFALYLYCAYAGHYVYISIYIYIGYANRNRMIYACCSDLKGNFLYILRVYMHAHDIYVNVLMLVVIKVR